MEKIPVYFQKQIKAFRLCSANLSLKAAGKICSLPLSLTPRPLQVRTFRPASLLSPHRLTLPPHSWPLSALSERSCLQELETMEYKLVKKKKKKLATGSRRSQCQSHVSFYLDFWGAYLQCCLVPNSTPGGQGAGGPGSGSHTGVICYLHPLLERTLFYPELPEKSRCLPVLISPKHRGLGTLKSSSNCISCAGDYSWL